MVPLKVAKDGGVEIISDHIELKRDVCHRAVFHNGAVWTIDRLGNLFKIELSVKNEGGYFPVGGVNRISEIENSELEGDDLS
jgi:hypothetical protein